MSSHPSLWRRLCLAAVSLALFFLLLEGLLAAVGVRPLAADRDPFLGFSRRTPVFELDPARGVWLTPPRAVLHSFNYQEFKQVKAASAFRLFVLGGSSAYGFPWGAEVAFTRLLGDALAGTYPDREIEAINAAAMSYGSHRLRVLTHEILDHAPDLIVIYEAHNEFVEQRFYRDVLSRQASLDPLRELLYRWRLYSGLTRWYEARRRRPPEAAREPGKVGDLLGLDVAREYSVDVSATERDEVRRRFEANLRAILDLAGARGVPLILCTTPSNVRDWAPNQSVFDAGTGAAKRREVERLLGEAVALLERHAALEALPRLERARDLAPAHAEVRYRLGQSYEALGRWDEARASYSLARDLDGQPSRAPRALNDVIRGLGREAGAVVVDIEQILEHQAPHGLMGFDLFEDYVHPKPEAHRTIAFELWRTVLERGLAGPPRRPDPAWFWGRPFPSPSGTRDGAPDRGSLQRLFNLGVVLENQRRIHEAMAKYQECLALDERHHAARMNLARLLHEQRRFEEAAEHYRRAALDAAGESPLRARSKVGLGESLRAAGHLEAAVAALREATDIDPASASAWRSLGAALAEARDLPRAEAAFRRALELGSDDADLPANLGFALLLQGHLDVADAVFLQDMAAHPERRRSANGHAAVLTERGRLDEARSIFEESLRVDPRDAFARGGLALIARRSARAGGE